MSALTCYVIYEIISVFNGHNEFDSGLIWFIHVIYVVIIQYLDDGMMDLIGNLSHWGKHGLAVRHSWKSGLLPDVLPGSEAFKILQYVSTP